jgi:hypothetical protein
LLYQSEYEFPFKFLCSLAVGMSLEQGRRLSRGCKKNCVNGHGKADNRGPP